MADLLSIAQQMIAHYNAQDPDAYVSLMTDDACEANYRGAVVREGKEGTREGLKAAFARWPQNHAEIIATLYGFLMSPEGRIPEDWFTRQVALADRTDGDIDTLARARIPRFPGRTLLHLEHAEIPQLDAMLFDQRLDDRLECGLNDLLGLQLSQLMLVGNRFDYLFLRHVRNPPGRADHRRNCIGAFNLVSSGRAETTTCYGVLCRFA